jgi:type IV secretion system protein VirB11
MREGQADTSAERRRAMLRSAMGPSIADALADPLVVEIMVNPDGRLWLDRLGEGRIDTGLLCEAAQTERIIRLVASHARARRMPMRRSSRQNSAAWEGAGERFEGLLPPVTRAPCFAIRKPASRIHRLTDYVHDGIMDEAMASTLADAVSARSNILVVGGTSSGKTTLANALLAEMANLDERVILIEDTRELQCAAPDTVALRTRASRDGGGVTWPIWCAPHCACGPTGSWSARSAAPKPSICSRPGTPGIPAGLPRSMPTAPRRRSIASSSWFRKA